MAYKYSFIFTAVTGGTNAKGTRVGGWSESLYHEDRFNTQDAPITKLMAARAGMFPSSTAITGLRVANVDVKNQSQVFRLNVTGTWDSTPDQPKVCVVVEGRGSAGQVQRLTLRGIPDEGVVRGEQALNVDMEKKLQKYLNTLQGFYQPCRKLDAVSGTIVTVSDTGLVTTSDTPAIVAQDFVYILRTRSPQNRKPIVGGKFQVSAAPTARTFQLVGWTKGDTILGRIRKAQVINNGYIPANMDVTEVSTREVGKPFFSYRGRRSTAALRTA